MNKVYKRGRKHVSLCFITNQGYFSVLFDIFRMWKLQAPVLHWWGKYFVFKVVLSLGCSLSAKMWTKPHLILDPSTQQQHPVRTHQERRTNSSFLPVLTMRIMFFRDWYRPPIFPVFPKREKRLVQSSFLILTARCVIIFSMGLRSTVKIGPVPLACCIVNAIFQTWSLAKHPKPVENYYPCKQVKWCGPHHVYHGSVPNFCVVQMGLSTWKECQLWFGLSFAKKSWLQFVSGHLFIDYRSYLLWICSHTIKPNRFLASR